jgi:hypothetical protein
MHRRESIAQTSRGRDPHGSNRTDLLRSLAVLAAATIVALLLLVVLRGTDLLSHALFNPDEAELLALGKRAGTDLIPYQNYTTSTSLYLWPSFLGILAKLGVPMTLPTAHVLSGLFYAYLVVAGWYLFYRQHGWGWATAIVAPPAIYLFAGVPGISSADFLSLGTELLPIAILMTGMLILFLPNHDISLARLIGGSFVCGSAIWAKPQVAPLAFGVIASAVIIRELERRKLALPRGSETKRDAFIALGSFILPSILSVLVIYLAGEFSAFWHETVVAILSYSAGAHHVGAPGNGTVTERAQLVGAFLLSLPFAAVWALGGLLGWSWSRRDGRPRWLELVAWIAPVTLAVASLFLLPLLYPHYGNLVFAGALASGIVGCRIARIDKSSSDAVETTSNALAAMAAVAAFVAVLAVAQIAWGQIVFLRGFVAAAITNHELTPVDPYRFETSKLRTWCPDNSSVQVWGWAAELYAYYDWMPATRYVDTQWQLFTSRETNYLRAGLLRDLEASRPVCIVEAIGPGFFTDDATFDSLPSVIPAARPFLKSAYIRRRAEVGAVTTRADSYPIVAAGGQGEMITVYVRRRACAQPQASPRTIVRCWSELRRHGT